VGHSNLSQLRQGIPTWVVGLILKDKDQMLEIALQVNLYFLY